ncbi:folate-binding protein [Haloechinothrix sp. LS1_15]|uniref:CAF17-like 4Fe-4S cluster assembly/insertion protein YgfZ n=1 Tax=Haloechinothrix sp. LS1_15 TaxID=2652248 RepID=UPI00294B8808|nr:folate-binding protein [Haloechinothrix sp. LS1_15]
MFSPILDQHRAVPAPEGHPDEGVPWHFGDPFAEQRAAASSVAVVDRSHRAVYTVTGSERLSWLHLVISQHVSELADGEGTEALVLDSHGRVEAHLLLAHAGETVWLDTEQGNHATSALPAGGTVPLLDYLDAMRFWSDVAVTDATGDRAVLTLLGPDSGTVLDELGLALPDAPYAVAQSGDVIARRVPWPTSGRVDLLVPRAELVTWWQRCTEAGARAAGSWAFEALRVEAVQPRHGVDTDERTIPHEVHWIGSAAHVAKGCYRGQETVAKVFNVGRPPRHLLLLHIDGSPEITPETGDGIRHGERTVGRVGTVVQHHELGPVALGLLKRSTPLDAELVVGDEDRAVQASIDPDSVPEEGPAPGREAISRLKG